jgi:hypothetical protein
MDRAPTTSTGSALSILGRNIYRRNKNGLFGKDSVTLRDSIGQRSFEITSDCQRTASESCTTVHNGFHDDYGTYRT